MPSYGSGPSDRLRRVLELQLSVTGQQGLDDINNRIKKNTDLIDVLGQQYSQSVISGEQYRASVGKLIAENDKLARGLDAVRAAREKADYESRAAAGLLTVEELAMEELQARAVDTATAMDRLAAAKGRANAQSGALGRGVLDLSRALEDVATGGPVGGLNNLPGIFNNFGQAAGLTLSQINPLVTAVTVLGTGAYLLYKNWDTLTSAFGSGKAETEAEHFERLSKAVNKTNGEMLILQDLEDKRKGKSKDQSTIDSLRDARGPASEAVTKFIRDSMGPIGGFDSLLKGLADVAVARERNANPNATFDDLAAIRIKTSSSNPDVNPVARQLSRAAQGDRKELDALIGFARNAGNRFAVGDNFQASPAVDEFVRLFDREGPDAQRQKAALQARQKAAADAAKAAADAAKAQRDAENQKVDGLNEQGREHQAEVDRILDAQKEAKQAAERQRREAAQKLDRTLKADGKLADQAERDAAAAGYAQQFVGAGFNKQFAQFGGDMVAQRVKRGQPEDVAVNAVYVELLKTAANQEKQTSMLGEATHRLMMLEQHNRMMQARLNQIQGQMGRGRNRNPTLLPHPAQR